MQAESLIMLIVSALTGIYLLYHPGLIGLFVFFPLRR